MPRDVANWTCRSCTSSSGAPSATRDVPSTKIPTPDVATELSSLFVLYELREPIPDRSDSGHQPFGHGGNRVGAHGRGESSRRWSAPCCGARKGRGYLRLIQ